MKVNVRHIIIIIIKTGIFRLHKKKSSLSIPIYGNRRWTPSISRAIWQPKTSIDHKQTRRSVWWFQLISEDQASRKMSLFFRCYFESLTRHDTDDLMHISTIKHLWISFWQVRGGVTQIKFDSFFCVWVDILHLVKVKRCQTLIPTVLSLFCVPTVLFYCFWLQLHCTAFIFLTRINVLHAKGIKLDLLLQEQNVILQQWCQLTS